MLPSRRHPRRPSDAASPMRRGCRAIRGALCSLSQSRRRRAGRDLAPLSAAERGCFTLRWRRWTSSQQRPHSGAPPAKEPVVRSFPFCDVPPPASPNGLPAIAATSSGFAPAAIRCVSQAGPELLRRGVHEGALDGGVPHVAHSVVVTACRHRSSSPGPAGGRPRRHASDSAARCRRPRAFG
jgi:hypothetical protein